MFDEARIGLTMTGAITAVLAAVVAAHTVAVRMIGGRTRPLIETITLALLVASGGAMIWFEVGRRTIGGQPWLLQVGGLALYAAGLVVYVEIRSLLSRGYSIRILVDLLRAGGTSTIESLKSGYGGGKGLDGLLRKRIASLQRLHLVYADSKQIGPMTWPGRLCAVAVVSMRRILRLDRVG